jgi:hypothetical protein
VVDQITALAILYICYRTNMALNGSKKQRGKSSTLKANNRESSNDTEAIQQLLLYQTVIGG